MIASTTTINDGHHSLPSSNTNTNNNNNTTDEWDWDNPDHHGGIEYRNVDDSVQNVDDDGVGAVIDGDDGIDGGSSKSTNPVGNNQPLTTSPSILSPSPSSSLWNTPSDVPRPPRQSVGGGGVTQQTLLLSSSQSADNATTPASRRLVLPSSGRTGTPIFTPLPVVVESSSSSSTTIDTSDFEEMMRERNRIRKEKEDYQMAALKVQIGRLEDALAAETKRRVDATTKLDGLARSQVFEVEERLRNQLQQDNDKLHQRLEALEKRVQRLEERWEKESHQQVLAVQSRADDLNRALTALQEQQATERKARLKREGFLLQQVEDHARECEERWNEERKDRMARLAGLEEQVASQEGRIESQQREFEGRIEKEMAALTEELQLEVQERQLQDEEIVAAMNRYTQLLQQCLGRLE